MTSSSAASGVFMFEPEQIRSACGGKWLRKPPSPVIIRGVGIDSRETLNHKAFLAIRGARHDAHDHLEQAVQNGAALLIVESSRVRSLNLPDGVAVMHVESTRKALGRIAHAHRRSLRGTKVIAVTGSSGKTTTKRLIHGVLSDTFPGVASPASFNNEIGVPLTLLSAKSSDRYIVAEVGTNAPGEIADLAELVGPDIAVITMIGRSHLEGLGSLEGVAREKGSLLAALSKSDGVAIINADYPLLRPHLKGIRTKILFGEHDDADLRLTGRGESDGRWWFEINRRTRFTMALPGKHNAINALAAVAVGRRFGLDDEAIQAGLASVKPEAMRMTPQSLGGVLFFNDAYNANPDSMIAALDTFGELSADAPRRLIVLGDMLELGDDAVALHREIASHVLTIHTRTPLEHVMLVGPNFKQAMGVLVEGLGRTRVSHATSPDARAANTLRELLRAGDAVLLKASRSVGLERLIESFAQPAKTTRRSRRTTTSAA